VFKAQSQELQLIMLAVVVDVVKAEVPLPVGQVAAAQVVLVQQ
jgi:hypothetical protein